MNTPATESAMYSTPWLVDRIVAAHSAAIRALGWQGHKVACYALAELRSVCDGLANRDGADAPFTRYRQSVIERLTTGALFDAVCVALKERGKLEASSNARQ